MREDSHWKRPEDADSAQVDENTARRQGFDEDVVQNLLQKPAAGFYLPCLESDEDQSACFKLGNLYVRNVEQVKEPSAEEDVNDGVHEEVLVDL